MYWNCSSCFDIVSLSLSKANNYQPCYLTIREWYSYHFPELIKIVPDNQLYARVVHYVGDRKSLSEERMEGLEEVVMDSTKAQAIVEAARMSMGEGVGGGGG